MYIPTLIAGLILRLVHPQMFSGAYEIGDILLWASAVLVALTAAMLIGVGAVFNKARKY